MAKLKQAIYWMRKGEKVARPGWEKDSYLEIVDSITQRVLYSDGTNAVFHLKQLEATDWMLWKEEEKDLSMSNERVKNMIRILRMYDVNDISIDTIINYLEKN